MLKNFMILQTNDCFLNKELISNDNVLFSVGVVLQYFLLNSSTWWLFHVGSIFYKVMFPLTARKWRRKEKFIHLFLLITGVLQTIVDFGTMICCSCIYLYASRPNDSFTTNGSCTHNEQLWPFHWRFSSHFLWACER